MGRTGKGLKLVGIFEILIESVKIIRHQAKLLRTIALAIILPYVLITLACEQLQSSLLAEMESLLSKIESLPPEIEYLDAEMESVVVTKFVDVVGPRILQYTKIIGLKMVCSAAFVPSIVAVAYAVGSVYNGKQQSSLTRVMRTLPTLCKNLIITRLCHLILSSMFLSAFYFVAFSLMKFCLIAFDKSHRILFNVGVVSSLVTMCVNMYMRILWEVAVVMCVMEEEYYGFEGIKKSRRLVQGKRSASVVLGISYLLISHLIVYVEGNGAVYGVGLGSKIVYGTARVLFSSVFLLVGEVTQSVLYFACKTHHEKSVDECLVLNKYENVNNNSCRLRSAKMNGMYLPVAV